MSKKEMLQKKYWNSVANTKNFTTPVHFQEFSQLVPKSAKILDLGCGYGRIMAELYEHGYKNLLGMDFSEKLVERGKKNYPHLKFAVQESKYIALPDNNVDVVILFAVLTCIIDDSEQDFLLSEIERVLKPGGIIYINDFLLNSDERNVNRYNACMNKYNHYGIFELPDGAILRHHHPEYIKKLLNRFEWAIFNRQTYTTMNGNSAKGFYYFGRKRLK